MTDTPKQPSCACAGAPNLIFACSGAADAGHIADLTARQMTREGTGKMYCLAGIGGRVSGIMETTRAAAAILAIDGCPLDCVKHTLEQAEFNDFQHLRVTDLGLEKGNAPATDDNVAKVKQRGQQLLAN